MTNSFHQIPLDLPSSLLLSVATPWRLYRQNFLPEGAGPASGKDIVRNVFADFDEWIIVIFDNFLVLAHSYVDATAKLRIVLERCMAHRLVLKIGTDVVTFFGYEVRPNSWGLSQTRNNSIAAMIFPQNQKRMQSFLGAAIFFHTHIPKYAAWAADLYGPRITKPYLTYSKQPSKMLLLCIFRIIPYLGLSALTPLTMRLVLFCSKNSPHHLVQSCINPLRSPPTNTWGLPLSGTRLNKRHIPYTSLSPNLVTTSAAKTFYLRRIIVTSFRSKIATYLLLFDGVFSCKVTPSLSNTSLVLTTV